MFSVVLDRIREATGESLYRPLEDARTVRLLFIVPDSSPSSPGFKLILQHFSLNDTPCFDVLSYTRYAAKYDKAIAKEWSESKASSSCREFDAWNEDKAHNDKDVPKSLLELFGSTVQEVASQVTEPTRVKVNNGTLAVPLDVFRFLKFAYSKGMYRPRDLNRADLDNKMDLKVEDSYLWVDHICLNQKDGDEMAAQVPLLGNIYKRSRRSLVWLSEHQPPEGMDWIMTDFAPKCIEIAEAMGPDFVWKEDPLGLHKVMEAAFGKEAARNWLPSMFHLWTLIGRHRYVANGWVQETLMSPETKIMCGDKVWDWVLLERLIVLTAPALMDVILRGLSKERPKLVARWRLIVNLMQTSQTIRRWWIDGSAELRRRDLVDIFGSIHDEQAAYCQISMLSGYLRGRLFTHKNDKIYGWLGLTQLCLPQGKTFGSPSYALPASTVFLRFARALIKGMPSLDVLNQVGNTTVRKVDEKLPSWVPDYSVMQLPRSLLTLNPKVLDSGFDATRGRMQNRASHGAICHEGDKLAVDGILLDVIRHRGPRLPFSEGNVGKMRLEWFLERCLALDDVYLPTGQLTQEALSLTLAAGGIKEEEATMSRECFLQVWADMITDRMKAIKEEEADRLMGFLYMLGARAKKEKCNWIPSSRAEWEAWRMNKTINKGDMAFRRRRFSLAAQITTACASRAPLLSKKRYWGLCSVSVEAGDTIWLLEGGRTPYVLRKVERDEYVFMGEAYVHGFMHGEGWTEEATKEMQGIIIR
jgi:hypothetical protein